MKTKLVVAVCALAVGLGNATPAAAYEQTDPMAMVADTVIARPACFAATVVGTAFFVISLPFSALSKSVDQAADALVVRPAKATFTRPLGDFSELSDYSL